MKKTSKFLVAVLSVAAVVASCQKPEFEEKVEMPKEEVQFAAVTEAGVATKMTLGTELKPEWQKSDQLAIYDGTEVNQFVVAEATGSYAVFNGKVTSGSDKFWAIFPYEEAMTYDASVGFKATIPAEQTVASGDSVSTTALMAMAYAERSSEGSVQFAFKNVCGLIQVTIPESGKISSVVISSNGEEKFAGTGTVKLQDGLPVFTPVDGAVGSVTLRPEGDTFEAGNYYAAVAPVKFATGFSISLVRTDGATGTKSTDKVMEVVRSGGTNLKDVVAVSDWSIKIFTKEQLFAWGANWGKKDHVTLMADIDMENELWTPVGNASVWFNGTFDGNGKKIYNLNVNTDDYAGFIGHLAGNGVIKNLTIGANSEGVYDGNSVIMHTPSKDEGNWCYAGAVAKVSGSAYAEGVVNYAKIEIPASDYKVKACLGGVIGFSDSDGDIVDCINHGQINLLAENNAVENNLIGGVVSKCNKSMTIDGCENHGKITNRNKGVLYIGGVVANTRSDNFKNETPTIVTGCKNTGAIEVFSMSYEANTENECAVGGICGMLQNANLNSCTNEGKITLSTPVSSGHYVGGIAGIRRNSYDTSITNCVNGTEGMTSSLFEYTTTSGDIKMGGVLGHCHKSSGVLNLSGCKNHSPITISNGCAVLQVGGLIGAVAESVILTVDDCHNKGNMNLSSVSTSTNNKNIGGIIGFLRYNVEAATDVHTVKNSTNSGNITSSASAGGETDIAGIVGYANLNALIQGCENSGNVSTTGQATKPRTGGITGVAHTNVTIENCTNKGAVTNTSSDQRPYVGGVSGYGTATSIKGCYNKGEVKVTNAGGIPQTGGILGNDAGKMTIDGCYNQGNVTVTKSTGTVCAGGISCNSATTTTIKNCVNEATVKISQNGQHAYSGGIVGLGYGKVLDCQNASTAKVIVEHTASTAKYALAGGVVGKTSGSALTVSGCVNYGSVEANIITDNKLSGAGGIIGQPQKSVTLTNNTNYGPVTAYNTHTTGRAFAGGIFGTDGESTSNNGATSVTGNVNHGTITVNVPTPAENDGLVKKFPGAAAGGLFGFVAVSTGLKDASNINHGNVVAIKGSESGAAGAIAGASNIATWSAKVGKSVSVNGVAWNSAWAEGADTEDETNWLCPSATNPPTATYVDAPAN